MDEKPIMPPMSRRHNFALFSSVVADDCNFDFERTYRVGDFLRVGKDGDRAVHGTFGCLAVDNDGGFVAERGTFGQTGDNFVSA